MYSYRKKNNNPDYDKINEIFNDYITHYNKKLGLKLVKCEIEVKFIKFHSF